MELFLGAGDDVVYVGESCPLCHKLAESGTINISHGAIEIKVHILCVLEFEKKTGREYTIGEIVKHLARG